jgi:hypothetical protein
MPEDIETHCRGFAAKGCAGADLLAYRATAADPIALIRAAKKGLGGKRLIVAGSIGSAVLDGSYAPSMGSVLSQLAAVQADLEPAR